MYNNMNTLNVFKGTANCKLKGGLGKSAYRDQFNSSIWFPYIEKLNKTVSENIQKC